MKSLAARIAVATGALTALVVAVCATGVWFAAESILVNRLDEDLEHRLNSIQRLFPSDPTRPLVAVLPDEFKEGGSAYMQAIDRQSHVELLRSPSLEDKFDLVEASVQVDGKPGWNRFSRDKVVRVVARGDFAVKAAIVPRLPGDLLLKNRRMLQQDSYPVLWVGQDAANLSRDLSRLRWLLFFSTILAAAFATGLAWWLRDILMRPVARLAKALARVRVSADGLSDRIIVDAPVELAPISQRLNSLLRELEQVIAREKHTIANIAHELRTPISGLRTELEFGMVREPQGLDPDAIRRCLGIATGMQSLVTNLLQLARLEAGSVTVVPADVDLEEVVDQAWDLIAHRAASRRVRLSLAAALEDPVVVTCPDKSRVVITNLLDNAVSHTPEGSAVVVSWSADERQVMLRLSNPVDHAVDTSRLFIPFWRAEESRTGGDGDHCGLGLALVARIMRLLGGRVGADVSDGRFVVEVAFPRHSGERISATSTSVQTVDIRRKKRRVPATTDG